MKLRIVFLFLAPLILAQGVIGQKPAPEPDRGYQMGPGDKLSIKVLGEPDFDIEPRIDEDGNFQVPFFDQGISAKCKTEKDLRTEVARLLTKYLKDPQVSISVIERKSRMPAVILGAVVTQQQIELRRKATLLELLSMSGGVTEEAGGMIQVFRTQPELCMNDADRQDWIAESNDGLDVPSRMYSLGSLQRGSIDANPEIHPGDIIVVQKASPVYITGEVVSPQGIRLGESGLTLTQAIAMVGGLSREAKTKLITIYRLKSDSKQREAISVNYDLIKEGTEKDPTLEPYDIVQVDKTKKSFGQVALEVITGVGKTGISAMTSGLSTAVIY